MRRRDPAEPEQVQRGERERDDLGPFAEAKASAGDRAQHQQPRCHGRARTADLERDQHQQHARQREQHALADDQRVRSAQLPDAVHHQIAEPLVIVERRRWRLPNRERIALRHEAELRDVAALREVPECVGVVERKDARERERSRRGDDREHDGWQAPYPVAGGNAHPGIVRAKACAPARIAVGPNGCNAASTRAQRRARSR
jgi:hypothetical protein